MMVTARACRRQKRHRNSSGEDFETKVLVLPDSSDPDEFIRAHGVEEYNERRGAGPPAHTIRARSSGTGSQPYAVRPKRPRRWRRCSRLSASSATGFRSASISTWRWTRCASRSRRCGVSSGASPERPDAVATRRCSVRQVAHVETFRPRSPSSAARTVGSRCGVAAHRAAALEEADYEGLPTAPLFRALVERSRRGGS